MNDHPAEPVLPPPPAKPPLTWWQRNWWSTIVVAAVAVTVPLLLIGRPSDPGTSGFEHRFCAVYDEPEASRYDLTFQAAETLDNTVYAPNGHDYRRAYTDTFGTGPAPDGINNKVELEAQKIMILVDITCGIIPVLNDPLSDLVIKINKQWDHTTRSWRPNTLDAFKNMKDVAVTLDGRVLQVVRQDTSGATVCLKVDATSGLVPTSFLADSPRSACQSTDEFMGSPS